MNNAKSEAMWQGLVETAYEAMQAGKLEAAEELFANALAIGRVLGKTPAEMRHTRRGCLAVLTRLAEES